MVRRYGIGPGNRRYPAPHDGVDANEHALALNVANYHDWNNNTNTHVVFWSLDLRDGDAACRWGAPRGWVFMYSFSPIYKKVPLERRTRNKVILLNNFELS